MKPQGRDDNMRQERAAESVRSESKRGGKVWGRHEVSNYRLEMYREESAGAGW